jgi:hypothetical protein
MRTKYRDFTNYILLESILEVDSEFRKILGTLDSKSKIEKTLIDWIDNEQDIKTNYNFLSTSTSNDKISYLQDPQYQRYKSQGENLSSRIKTEANIGRFARSILTDNAIQFTEPDIEDFVNSYKSVWNSKYNPREFSIVRGKDINFWYLEKNYMAGGHYQLGNSCMKGATMNSRMNFYSDNPDKVSMMILTDLNSQGEKKLISRALLWRVDDSIFVDRIYSNSDDITTECRRWLKSNIKNPIFRDLDGKSPIPLQVSLQRTIYSQYPYMDTLMWLVHDLVDNKLVEGSGVLHSEEPKESSGKIIFKLRNHRTGTPETSYLYIEKLSRYYLPDELVKVEDSGLKWPKNLCVYSDLYNSWIIREDAVESTFHNSWIRKYSATNILDLGLVDANYVHIGIEKYIGNQKDYPWVKLERLIGQDVKSYMQLKVLGKNDYNDYLKIDLMSLPVAENSSWSSSLSKFSWYKEKDLAKLSGNKLWPKMFCISVWNINWNKIFRKFSNDTRVHSVNLIISDINKFAYKDTILQIDAKLLGIDDCIERPEFRSVFDSIWYDRSYYGSENNLLNFEELKHNSLDRITNSERNWRISLIEFSEKISEDLSVSVKNEIKNLENERHPEKILRFINSAKNLIESKLTPILIDNIKEDFSEWCQEYNCSEEDLLNIFKLFSILYLRIQDTGAVRRFILRSAPKYNRWIYERIPDLSNSEDLTEFRSIFYHKYAGIISSPNLKRQGINIEDLYLYLLSDNEFLANNK